MGADEALLALGMVGRWQLMTYTLTSVAYVIPCVTVYFTFASTWFAGHDFHCVQRNDSLTTDESFPVAFDPDTGQNVHSRCKRYVTLGNFSNITETCDAWTYNPYPFQWTAVIEWDLVCDKAAYLETAQLVLRLAGTGAFFLASFPDWFGRRRTLIVTQIITTLFLVAAAFATSPYLMLALQFFSGVIITGGCLAWQVITAEIFPSDVRLYTIPMQTILYQLAVLIWVLLVYFTRDLRKLQLVIAGLSTILLYFYRWCPESVRWLVANQRYDEAQKILDNAAKVNQLSPVPAAVLRTTDAASSGQRLSDTKTPTMLGYLRRGRTCGYFFAQLFMMLTTQLGYAGMIILLQLLSGDLFLNYFIFALLGIPGIICAVFLMHFFGRRYTLILLYSLAGISMATATLFHALPVASIETDMRQKLVTTFALLTTFALNGLMSVNDIYSQEIFPTVIRSTGSGIVQGLSSGGAIVGPSLVLFLNRTYSVAFPLGIMATLFLLAAFSAVSLPEVLGRPLPETIQEVIDWPRTLNKEDWVKIKQSRSFLWQQIKQGSSVDPADATVALNAS